MARDLDPSPQRQFIFIVIIAAVAAGVLFLLSFYIPQETEKLAYLLIWVFLLAGLFWLAEKLIRSLSTKRK
jgi:hypothetical protein